MASTLGEYKVTLRNQSGVDVATFDSWKELTYSNVVNGVGDYTFAIDGNDSRRELFELDGQIIVQRRVPELNLDWYTDFEGFHRKQERITEKSGERSFVSRGLDYNDLLARTIIGFKDGTIRAVKSAAAETVMKEFVSENCTALADDTTVVGRLNYDEHLNNDTGGIVYAAALPGFIVEVDEGRGDTWSGSRPYENLLTTLQLIAQTTGVDFKVSGNGRASFVFKVYPNGIGKDLRNVIVGGSRVNIYGNVPLTFSISSGTAQEMAYTNDALTEYNAVMVLGENDGSLREVYTVANTERIETSPWNRREIARPGSNQQFDYQYRQLGDEILKDSAFKEGVEFVPLQTETSFLGKHFDVGYVVSVTYDQFVFHKRIAKKTVRVREKNESIAIEFTDARTQYTT